ncbi:MAG: amidoligase family protein [Salinisphaeraceae bacterium]|nr:amidoligase family protein [Salinisphaeraceae bacterium]
MQAIDTQAYRQQLWPVPPVPDQQDGSPRRLGVEIEFAGLSIERISEIACEVLGGEIEKCSNYEYFLRETPWGDFGIELDFSYLKKLGRERAPDAKIDDLDDLAESVLALLARQVVPYEVVSPPLPMAEVWRMDTLIQRLRREGAKGTKHALSYAFGLHLNPEMPDLEAETVLNYLRAFLSLFEWLKDRSDVDLSRRVTPYIDPFEKDYIRLVTAENYAPDMDQLIDDYLEHNPTRNRALDMLPLFCHIDEPRVRAKVDDDRVKPRPALHYRLPNCQIDEKDWGLIRPWKDWLQIEALAADPKRLDAVCRGYRKYLANPTSGLFSDWGEASARWLLPELL